MEKKLPDNFYWGGSVSSFQTEGARNEGGKGVCIYDVRPTDPEFSDVFQFAGQELFLMGL